MEDPDSAESFFQKFENDWARLVRQIENRFGRRQDVVASLLLVQSSNFLLRNPKFSRIGTDERIDIFKSVWNIYWKEVLMGGHIPEKIEDAAQQLLSTWTCYLLPAKEESWITSDNPVILLSYKNTTPAIVFLPITPTWALLALKKNVIKLISSTITKKDIEYLNSYTVINSIRHLYSNRAFDSVKIASVAKWMERRPATDNWISKEQIHIEPFNYPAAGMTLGILKE